MFHTGPTLIGIRGLTQAGSSPSPDHLGKSHNRTRWRHIIMVLMRSTSVTNDTSVREGPAIHAWKPALVRPEQLATDTL